MGYGLIRSTDAEVSLSTALNMSKNLSDAGDSLAFLSSKGAIIVQCDKPAEPNQLWLVKAI